MKNTGLIVLLLLLAGCGGAGGSKSSSSDVVAGCTYAPTTEVDVTDTATHPSDAEASRFLQQASFGPTRAAIDALKKGSPASWLARQFEQPRVSHLSCVDQEAARQASLGSKVDQSHFLQSWWGQAITGRDQLRQRVAFALSQTLVISFDGSLSEDIRGVASYYDVLEKNAFGNYRDLLEDVSLHPSMGVYLSHLRNRKEDAASGRTPDENYAREVMQLFSIGLYQLNTDGSLKLDSNSKPIETNSNADVSGLAKVFTGYSHGGPDTSNSRFFGGVRATNYDVIPMQGYPQYHSISAKQFLGVTIPAQGAATTASMASDLKIALDTLFNHDNVGPFIGKQLIQRLVKSNPSPAYVSRVATAFNTGTTSLAPSLGTGRRGDMRATIAAILLDPEARPASLAVTEGKLIEPVVRLANWARAFNVASASGAYKVGNTDSANTALNQTPMRSTSVFNFYRPGYVPPNTRSAAAGMVVPEMQITHETSVAGYLNFMQSVVQNGVGSSVAGVRDVRPNYAAEIALADNSDALISRVDVLLTRGAMKALTRASIKTAVDAVTIPAGSTSSASSAANLARQQRTWLAVFLTMASPDYLVQK